MNNRDIVGFSCFCKFYLPAIVLQMTKRTCFYNAVNASFFDPVSIGNPSTARSMPLQTYMQIQNMMS